jgi:hypothetical protein
MGFTRSFDFDSFWLQGLEKWALNRTAEHSRLTFLCVAVRPTFILWYRPQAKEITP